MWVSLNPLLKFQKSIITSKKSFFVNITQAEQRYKGVLLKDHKTGAFGVWFMAQWKTIVKIFLLWVLLNFKIVCFEWFPADVFALPRVAFFGCFNIKKQPLRVCNKMECRGNTWLICIHFFNFWANPKCMTKLYVISWM